MNNRSMALFLVSSFLFLTGCTPPSGTPATNQNENKTVVQENTNSIGCKSEEWFCDLTQACVKKGDVCSNGMPGGDLDEYGCKPSTGYTWCAPKNKCMRLWEESCYTDEEATIAGLLATKYNKPVADVTVRIRQKTDRFVRGDVTFAAKDLPPGGAGGLVLAVREGDSWQLVFDGNGSVDCQKIKTDLAFPADMLGGICD